jgi:ABC-type dipeptide/oligopeptide/nickel transport system permease component
MLAFILRRLAQSVVVMLVVAFISFIMFRYVGDPIANLVGQDSRLSDIEALRERLGLNAPIYMQFLNFIGNALRGEFGISYRLQQPVADLIVSR